MKKSKEEQEFEDYFGEPMENSEVWAFLILGVCAWLLPVLLAAVIVYYFK